MDCWGIKAEAAWTRCKAEDNLREYSQQLDRTALGTSAIVHNPKRQQRE